MVKILVIATVPPHLFEAVVKASRTSRMDYPSYLKKIQDLGNNYNAYTMYECEDDKYIDAFRMLAKRYHRIAVQVPGYTFTIDPMFDIQSWSDLLVEKHT